ncbi:SDR family oxidoreductase [Reichenbachiella sp. MSK19-1]|uniref:SDR family oxidoreductase n=1 Tax=Reichenbachiella TaxID=156993 RepID=UPI000E6D2D9D|nr:MULTISPECIES: SDR family oxidoreductase [Reichenbachiella]MBU2912658.1 SDR family oxidoreductase [Reichenbachiella agariperforans]RJE73165.1 short-chain dehydrogenase [Reichenbachiella sp. MSK19-1]
MDLKLKDKVVMITGGAGMKGSIGETIVRKLAEEGAIPIIVDRNTRGKGYVEELNQKGGDAMFIATDLTQPEQIASAIEAVGEKYGRIDVLINNVGVNDGAGLEESLEAFMDSLKLNMVSYFLMTKYCLPWLKQSKGNILNIGSKVGYTGQGGTSGYAASKGGVLALTREWAVDLIQYDIRVNCLIISESYTPAYEDWIKTLEDGEQKLNSIKDKIPFGNRMTEPVEIANQTLFTISELSSHTTGQHIFVDGGYVHLDRALLPAH